MFNKIIQFTHNDLDGYACNVVVDVFSKFLEPSCGKIDAEHHNCDYDSIDSVILDNFSRLFEHQKDETLFIVSDISWKSKETTEILKNVKWFIFADHHKSSEQLAKEIERFDRKGFRMSLSIDGRWCGCHRLLECLKSICHENGYMFEDTERDALDRLEGFTEIVNDWDLWKWADNPKVLNQMSTFNLLNVLPPKLNTYLDFNSQSVTGEDVHRFTDDMVNLILKNSDRSFMLDLSRFLSENKKFTEYISRQAVMVETACRQYQRVTMPMEIGPDIDALLFRVPANFNQKSLVSFIAERKTDCVKDFDCLMIYETGSGTVSLRYPKDGINLSFVAKYNGLAKDQTGGGHPFAAGFPVDPKSFKALVDRKKVRTL